MKMLVSFLEVNVVNMPSHIKTCLMATFQFVSSHLKPTMFNVLVGVTIEAIEVRCKSGIGQEMVWHVQCSDYSHGILSNFHVQNGKA
jgi:hypothetical protein